MMNKIFFSTLSFITVLTASSVACEAMSTAPNPIIRYKDCSDKVAQKFKARVASIKTTNQQKKEADQRHFIEIAKHEQKRCKETCVDAPQTAAGR
ncbi:MAG: hypothetical protein K0M45_04460 [Candidatus Paracaedibacteraceae bacterium]|nr:hypothetical protein [Candidatus Paracaedibacteraceae bacterium]